MADQGSDDGARKIIREEIRNCIREEMSQNRTSGTQSLINRTRNLIRGSASFAAQSLSSSTVSSPLTSTVSTPALTNIGKGKRSLPGHPYRFAKEKKSKKLNDSIPKSVYLLDEPDEELDEDYTLTDSMIILKGECDLYSNADENGIRSELVNLFKTKLLYITNKDFDFVRRDRNTISKPLVKGDHVWDFKHVKHLCGTGRLYVRLNVCKDTLIADEDDTESEPPSPPTVTTPATSTSTTNSSLTSKPVVQPGSGSHGHSGLTNAVASLAQPSTSAGTSAVISDDDDDDQNKVENMAAIFPTIPKDIVRNAVMTCTSLNTAVNVLLQYNTAGNDIDDGSNNMESTPQIPIKPETLPQILHRLRSKMQPRGTREKMKVDQDDIVMDVYSFYKSPDFDPKIPIFVSLKGQPAIDTGGVLRQVFSDAFYGIAHNEEIKHVFTGNEHKVPVFSNELVVNGLFEVLGKMIAHSLIQAGPGFPYLSPPIYWYLATGDLQIALQKASFSDVDNAELSDYITRITEAPETELRGISFESDWIRLLSEAGENRTLTADNKLDILQSLMLHNILVRKKAILDQFRKGLSILGLLEEIQKHPHIFEECFVFQGIVSNESVANTLHFPPTEDNDAHRVFQMLQMFVKNCKPGSLDNFLRFVTGTSCSAKCILPRRIRVSCEVTNSIFASTCLLELKLPKHFLEYVEFEAAMNSVISDKSFTTG